jgi:hypothetical protein
MQSELTRYRTDRSMHLEVLDVALDGLAALRAKLGATT